MSSEGSLPPIKWTAAEDAGASWDFETTQEQHIRFDAKSTTQNFETPFHLSGAETVAAASEDIPYRIIRLYELTEDGAFASVSDNINALAKSILQNTKHLPTGVVPVGFTIDPKALKWSEPIRLDRPDEPEEWVEAPESATQQLP